MTAETGPSCKWGLWEGSEKGRFADVFYASLKAALGRLVRGRDCLRPPLRSVRLSAPACRFCRRRHLSVGRIPAYASLSHFSIVAALRREVAKATDQTARAPLQAFVLAFWFARPSRDRRAHSAMRAPDRERRYVRDRSAARLLLERAASGLVATVFAFATLQIRFGNDAVLWSTATSTRSAASSSYLALLAWLRFSREKANARALRRRVDGVCDRTRRRRERQWPSLPSFPILFALQNVWAPGKRVWGIVAFIAVGAIVVGAADYAFAPGSIVLPSFGAILGQAWRPPFRSSTGPFTG